MAAETVTVRMSRSDHSTAWGFRLDGGVDYQRPVSIAGVVENSLAERAGLQLGDVLTQLCGRSTQNMTHQDVQNAVVQAGNNIDLLVQRHGGVRSIHSQGGVSTWRPEQTQPQQQQWQPQQQTQSKTHQVQSEFKTSSASSYGGKNKATDYLMQTGGLFGTDPAVAKAQSKQELNYNPATLAAIRQEDELRRAQSPYAEGRGESLNHTGNEQSGSFKRLTSALHAEGNYPAARSPRTIAYPDKCSTCGTSLQHTQAFTVNGKPYCHVHAAQHQQYLYGARPPQDPNVFVPHAPPLEPTRNTAPIKAFYQPDILKPGGVSAHSPRGGGISPFQRGVPHAYQGYGGDLTRELHSMSSTQQVYGGHYQSSTDAPPPMVANNNAAPFGNNAAPMGNNAAPFGNNAAPMGNNAAPFTNNAAPFANNAAPPMNNNNNAGASSQAPLRGRGVLKQLHDVPRIPVCEQCHREIRGPFVLAVGRTWCPDHFKCANAQCQRSLIDCGFVEEASNKYCERCFEQYFAPRCARCQRAVVGDCLNALSSQWHPECFCCTQCQKPFGNAAFFLEAGKPYCEQDWNELFTTKCLACQFPIEAGDRWVEALGGAYHSDCFNCQMCQKNLEGESFYAKQGRPFCKQHA